jgi:hypothetical protein
VLKRFKRTLVETYVGAIALGYLLAQDVLRLANIFAWPLEDWTTQKQAPEVMHGASAHAVLLRDALTQSAAFLLLFLLWYILFRWLYLKPSERNEPEPTPSPEQAV